MTKRFLASVRCGDMAFDGPARLTRDAYGWRCESVGGRTLRVPVVASDSAVAAVTEFLEKVVGASEVASRGGVTILSIDLEDPAPDPIDDLIAAAEEAGRVIENSFSEPGIQEWLEEAVAAVRMSRNRPHEEPPTVGNTATDE